jgi:hypothetical protein
MDLQNCKKNTVHPITEIHKYSRKDGVVYKKIERKSTIDKKWKENNTKKSKCCIL